MLISVGLPASSKNGLHRGVRRTARSSAENQINTNRRQPKGGSIVGIGKDGLQGAPNSLALWSGEIFGRCVMLVISNRVQYLRA